MDEPDTDSTDHLIDSLKNTSLIEFAGICHQAGCENGGFIYQYRDQLPDTSTQTIVCCNLHAKDAGFCFDCGEFWGEVMKSKYCEGLCPECLCRFSKAVRDNGNDDGEYDDEYYD